MFDKLESRLELSGWLTAETAFRIGAGRSTGVIEPDLPVVRDAENKPYIPGSSFKGVLRSYLERFARTIQDVEKIACHPSHKEHWCITDAKMKDERQKLSQQVARKEMEERDIDSRLTEWILNESCLPCLTFGSPWLASKVQVRDLLVDKNRWFAQFQVRNGVAIDRDTETADEGNLYDYEVIPSGVRFHLRLIIENGKTWQWGMVMAGLKAFKNGGIAIGGGKSRGLGAVSLNLEECKLFSLEGSSGDERVEKLFNFLDGNNGEGVSSLVGDEPIETQAKAWIAEFKRELAKRAKEAQT
jgi:CRISPR-associated RAMP protein (TIGR02581 family)